MSQPPTTQITAPRSRARRFIRWLVVTVFVAFAVSFAWNLFNRELAKRQGEREYGAAAEQANADDPNWDWERLSASRKRPPAGKNGAELIPRVKKLAHADLGKWQAKDELKTRLEAPANVRYSSAVLAEVRRELAASADAVALARTLKDCPFGYREITLRPNVLDTPLQDTQDTRAVVDLLRWDAVAALEDADTSRAATDLLAMLNAARSIGDEPFLISQLVRTAGRVITVRAAERLIAQAPDAPGLPELQSVLAVEAEEPLLLYGVRGERAMFDRLFGNLESGATTPDQAIDPAFKSAWSRFSWWNYSANLRSDRAYALWWMTTCVSYARQPIHEQPALFAAVPDPPKEPNRILSRHLLPAVDRVARAHWRTTAEVRCAVVGIACERFRQQHKQWPGALTELVPAFIPDVPLDPFSAEPLRFTKSEDGVVVYSVGKRLPTELGKPAARPELPEGVEIGFRLWNPDRRRLPAPPDPVEPAQNP